MATCNGVRWYCRATTSPGKSYPLIVKVYGGSAISNDLNRFGYAPAAIENLQLFATRGYAVLLADSKLNVGTPMVDLMKSVMPGINKVVEIGVADPAITAPRDGGRVERDAADRGCRPFAGDCAIANCLRRSFTPERG